MHVKFTCVNEIEGMYERPPVNVKVELRSTFTLTLDRLSIASILSTRVKVTRQWKSAFREFTAMFTLYRSSIAPARKPFWVGLQFTHKNCDFG